MKNIIKSIEIYVACMLLVANNGCRCNPEPEPQPEPEPTAYVRFSPKLSNYTRATDTAFEEGDFISVFAIDASYINYIEDGGNYADNVKFVYEDGYFVGSDNRIAVPKDGLYYHAIHPYTKNASDIFEFTVASDQTKGYSRSDLMTAHTPATSKETVSMRFVHRLSKVVIKLTGEGWGTNKTTNAELTGVYTTTEVDLNNLDFIPAGKKDNVRMKKVNDREYVAVIPSQTIYENDYFIDITVNGEVQSAYAISDIRLISGCQSEITINWDNEKITVFTGEINPWDE